MKQFSAHFAVHLSLLQALLIALLLWFALGDPLLHIANLLYPDGPAPWEEIDLAFMPDRDDPRSELLFPDLRTLDECRTQARMQADQHDDYEMNRSLWTCRVVHPKLFGDERVMRLTVN